MALTQSHFRFGVNDNNEATHNWHAAEDTNPTMGGAGMLVDSVFLLRFCIQADATGLNNIDAEFQYRKNGGTWTQISGTSLNVRGAAGGGSPVITEGANTTKRLSGTGTFEASSAGCTIDGIAGGAAFDIVASGNGEVLCAMFFRGADVVHGDVIEFRLTRDGGTLLDTYAVTPSVTIVEPSNQTIPTGSPAVAVTVTAPAATVQTSRVVTAGAPAIVFSAPSASMPGGAQTIPATAPVFTLSVPVATPRGAISLGAGAPVALFSAPAAILVASARIQAGAPTLLLTAPAAVIPGGPGGDGFHPSVHGWWMTDEEP